MSGESNQAFQYYSGGQSVPDKLLKAGCQQEILRGQ